jgi:hypothetical protein
MKPLYVAYYTPEYEEEARGLVDSLNNCRIYAKGPYHTAEPVFDLQPIERHNSWQKNTQWKSYCVNALMLDIDGNVRQPIRPIVYLDADARVRQYPILFDQLAETDCDFAAHWRGGSELLSGTLYFGATKNARDLSYIWKQRCWDNPDAWDQVCLQMAVDSMPGLKVERLPFSYCRIFDGQGQDEQGVVPVIDQMQASRRLRRVVDTGMADTAAG